MLTKRNGILELRLRLFRQSVETLYKEKLSIVQNVNKSSEGLEK